MITDFVKLKDVSGELIEKYEGKLPAGIIDLWKEYGFGTFYNGYLKVIDPDEYQKLLEASYFQGDVSIPVFATAFGDLITWEKQRFLGIVEYRYGENEVVETGFRYFLEDVADGELDKELFNIRQYRAAIRKYGELAYDECFGYVPLLALGGKESVNNLKKVKIREHIALISEMVGAI
ncbi:MAG: DUF1851 domain-containing protein [Lachnospiraceae bacterium]|nr:DUF1851 domain-containing protein [Lachnospiraceae bacterium]